MVNVSLIETILREQDHPGYRYYFLFIDNHRNIFSLSRSTTRQIRDLYNNRSGEDPILQHSDQDKLFQTMLVKTLEVKTNDCLFFVFLNLFDSEILSQ